MVNSAFKKLVIEYVVAQLPALLQLRRKNVMIDWNGETYQHITYIEADDWWVEHVPRECKLGEADVKFLYWAKLLSDPIAVISIDGDYVPIAMSLDFPVSVFRHSWIDIGALRRGLRVPLRELVMLMALTGTDYSRQLPWIKPKHLYHNVCFFRPLLSAAVANNSVDEDTALRFIAAAYELKFRKHNVSKHSFASAHATLMRSKLSEHVKKRLPSAAQARTTVRNAKFLLLYWSEPLALSTELHPYGFREEQGLVIWDDTV